MDSRNIMLLLLDLMIVSTIPNLNLIFGSMAMAILNIFMVGSINMVKAH